MILWPPQRGPQVGVTGSVVQRAGAVAVPYGPRKVRERTAATSRTLGKGGSPPPAKTYRGGPPVGLASSR
jgi:hypothetical protein